MPITENTTRRVPSAPTADNTKRVATTGATAAIPAFLGGDTWGGTWGGTWGRTWLSVTPAVPAVAASPAADNTPRIGSAPTANNTKRVSIA